MVYEIVMPQLSDSMEEGKLISWKIKQGDLVQKGDVLAEVESDKAIMEVQSFKNGTVKDIKIKEGETIPVGTVIATIDTEEKAKQNISSPIHKEQSKKKISKSTKNDSFLDEILGTNEDQYQPQKQVAEGNASAKAKALASSYKIDINDLQKKEILPSPAHEKDIRKYRLQHFFTPKALALLKLYHLDPALFTQDKKHNSQEIQNYIQNHDIPLPEPIDSFHKALIDNVSNAAKKPTYHLYDNIDTREILSHKNHSVTVWLIKIFSQAMMEHNEFRTILKEESFILYPNASISLAITNGTQLYMPVFKDANLLSPIQIQEQLTTFEKKVQAVTMVASDLSDSSFGISNLGMFGIERFDAMINKDDSAIAAIGAAKEGKMSITLTLDHRLINGYQAAQFMQTLKAMAIDPQIFKETTDV